MSGLKYKKHLIYVDKSDVESKSTYNERLWFIAKNICYRSYYKLITLSHYFVNVTRFKMKYQDEVHTLLNECNI